MRSSLDEFVGSKLKIPTGVLTRSDIGFVRRVKTGRKSKIQDEVVVQFTTVEARDTVQSYTRNLAEFVDKDGRPLAGIRMEVPERLMGEFKALEQYGHNMKTKHKKNFKRHIKIDDSLLCLYIDVFIPKTNQWIRVDMDNVREDNKARLDKKNKGTDKKHLQTCNSDDESDPGKD